MKKKGFTLIELLVVIAIIAMLLAILMPALGKVKRMAMRIVCATNLKGMGTAHMTYGLDYDDEFAAQGGKTDYTWGSSFIGWNNANFPWSLETKTPTITVASSLYLLVREADVSPASFICKNSGDKEFEDAGGFDLTELWDFGLDPAGENGSPPNNGTPTVSYAYQQPYRADDNAWVPGKTFTASGSGNPSNAIMADRNPWADNNLLQVVGTPDQKTFEKFAAAFVPPEENGQKWEVGMSNSASHSREGQNVLFGDGHVEFSRTPACGYENDNIYTPWGSSDPVSNGEDIRIGVPLKAKMFRKGFSSGATDSVLVNDSVIE